MLVAAARFAPDPSVALRLAGLDAWPEVRDYDALLSTGRMTAAYLLALLALTLPILTVLAWVRRWWKFGGRIHVTLVTVATLALVWWAWYWNLLGA